MHFVVTGLTALFLMGPLEFKVSQIMVEVLLVEAGDIGVSA